MDKRNGFPHFGACGLSGTYGKFKTTKQSYKSKKKIWNDPADWVIFENTQPPIIEESVFLIVQNIRKARRRPTKMGDMGMFSGLLYCADCGGKMYQCRATRIEVSHVDRKSRTREITIVYNFIGAFDFARAI